MTLLPGPPLPAPPQPLDAGEQAVLPLHELPDHEALVAVAMADDMDESDMKPAQAAPKA